MADVRSDGYSMNNQAPMLQRLKRTVFTYIKLKNSLFNYKKL